MPAKHSLDEQPTPLQAARPPRIHGHTRRGLTITLAVAVAVLGTSSCAGCGVRVECGGAKHEAGDAPVLDAALPLDGSVAGELVVFGDSLSDTGALLSQSFGVAPNPDGYFAGRFSNGPVWVDYVADALGLPSDGHAYGGAATTGDAGGTPKPFDAAVDQFLACAPDTLAPTSLFALWIGHNDYYGGAADPPAIAAATIAALDALAARGARHFLVPELLLLTGTPRPVEESRGGIDGATADERIVAHNAALQVGLDELEAKYDLAIARARPARMREQIVAQPALLGLTNTSDACFTGDVYWLTGGSGDICGEPDVHFHWDGVHPTTRVHCAYAVEMLGALADAGLAELFMDDADLLRRCRLIESAL
jgi:phospholipase/lecithinase/hemolysin